MRLSNEEFPLHGNGEVTHIQSGEERRRRWRLDVNSRMQQCEEHKGEMERAAVAREE